MKIRLLKLYDALTDSFWFLPALMALLAGGGALGTVAIDHKIGSAWVDNMGWVWSGGADGARSVLSVIAGSVMTVTSIVFSLTVTTLAQTSSHFGPRVLRNFTSDRGVQITLGTFIATFVYSLLVLRTVRSVEELQFVPYLSVNIGVVLALASLAVLIYFIHHISESIQAEILIANVGEDCEKTLADLFPEPARQSGTNACVTVPDVMAWKKASPVNSNTNGYLQRVDYEQLISLAADHDVCLKMDVQPGDFVAREDVLIAIFPAGTDSDALHNKLRSCFTVGRHRTPHQDARYGVQQLVEIGCHALSPGINEPYTALSCIDWLGAVLGNAAKRELPEPIRLDGNGKPRLINETITFAELVNGAFDPLRLFGAANPDIVRHLVLAVASVGQCVRRDEDREALVALVQTIDADALQIMNVGDRARIADVSQVVLAGLRTR